MFTSRAEYRLLLRIDNADLRLTPIGREAGLVSDGQWDRFEGRRQRYLANLTTLETVRVRDHCGDSVTASRLLKQPSVRLERLLDERHLSLDLDEATRDTDIASAETAVKYDGYLKQELARVRRARKEEHRSIPEGFPFSKVPGLSKEIIDRLSQVRPETLGQASRVPGVTPAAMAVLGVFIDRFPATPGHR